MLDTDVSTCEPGESLEQVRSMLGEQQRCVVVDDDRVVHGELRLRDLRDGKGATAEDRVRLGPTTIRADEYLGPLVERMRRAGVMTVLVTDPEGRLLGMLRRDSAEHVLHEWHQTRHVHVAGGA